jgi:hypothetical protein
MKVRVAFTVDATDELRRAIRLRHGEEGLATREEVRRWRIDQSEASDDIILWELEREEENE